MTGDPIDLDGRRTAERLLEAKMRRRSADGVSSAAGQGQPHLQSLEDQMLAEPARTWVEVMEKWRFLLDRYAATTDAGDERIRELVKRALGDMERMRRNEERK